MTDGRTAFHPEAAARFMDSYSRPMPLKDIDPVKRFLSKQHYRGGTIDALPGAVFAPWASKPVAVVDQPPRGDPVRMLV